MATASEPAAKPAAAFSQGRMVKRLPRRSDGTPRLSVAAIALAESGVDDEAAARGSTGAMNRYPRFGTVSM
jgi:hypothetical protein